MQFFLVMAHPDRVADRARPAGIAFGVLSLSTVLGCREPELTQARILDDLGKDELVLSFWTEPEAFSATRPCVSQGNLVSVDGERDAAVAAGWIERVCRDDPTRMRLTEDGRRHSVRWEKYEAPDTKMTSWRATVARYERTGTPIVARGAAPKDDDTRLPQRFVTIPGRYVPNEDGQRLSETGWKTIRTVDRVEKFILWKGVWARRHLGD